MGRYAGDDSAAGDIDYLASIGLLVPQGDSWRLARPVVPGFGRDAGVVRGRGAAPRAAGARSLTDVRLGPPGPGGDYDVLAKLDDRLLYVEVKSSPPKQIYAPEVAAFLERSRGARTRRSRPFLVDTRLRMGDKIVPMFDEELRQLPGAPALAPLEREDLALSAAASLWPTRSRRWQPTSPASCAPTTRGCRRCV